MLHFVYGCSSGFGKAITLKLLSDGHSVCGFSRSFPHLVNRGFSHYTCDVTDELLLNETLSNAVKSHGIPDGIVLNAGGPATGTASETHPADYRDAYDLVFDWKIRVVHYLLPLFKQRQSGRIVFIESQSLKQPIPNLVLSNSMRLAVAGFAKTLASEVARLGIQVNIIAPGSHNTPAIERVINAKCDSSEKKRATIKREMEESIPAARFGEPEELAALVAWLLSAESSFMTGQTISHDGGNVRHIFG